MKSVDSPESIGLKNWVARYIQIAIWIPIGYFVLYINLQVGKAFCTLAAAGQTDGSQVHEILNSQTMDNLINHFNNIDASFRKMKFVTVLSLVCAVVIAVGSVAASGWFMEKSNGTIYVVDKGYAVMATRSQEDSHRELEARDHVTRFHALMLNLSPSAEFIQRNLELTIDTKDINKAEMSL